MKQYKSLFKESGGSLEVREGRKAQQIVDISDLDWSKDMGQMTWFEAMSSCPSGWRLPTVQELYTAYVERVSGFKPVNYWSSSTHAQYANNAWSVEFDYGDVFLNNKKDRYYVRYVKEI